MSTNMSEFRSLPLAALTLSTTRSQAERRARFDKADLAELAESIKAVGLVQPILVRPLRVEHIKGEAFEVVAGERRVLAAKLAKLEEIPGNVRELTDEQVLELQLIENLQREGLHELAEAEGYEALQKLGHSIDDMAVKVGKSKATIYARMKLLALGKAGREAFYAGKISASIALLLSRIPVEKLQMQALKEILGHGGEYGDMSYREAADFIQRTYMLRLDQAPFPVGDATLVKSAGPCGTCPKNTLAQSELFGDVKQGSAGVCTDPGCFAAKKEAHIKTQITAAKAAGQTVLEGKEAKAVFPYESTFTARNGFVKLDETRYVDGKSHKVGAIIGKSAAPVLVRTKDGDLIPVVSESTLRTAMKAKGIGQEKAPSRGTSRGTLPVRKNDDRTAQAQMAALFAAIHGKAPRKLESSSLVKIVGIVSEIQGSTAELVDQVNGWKIGDAFREADSLKEPELHRLVWELLVIDELDMSRDESTQLDKLTKLANSLKIDAAAIKAKVKADVAAATKVATAKKSAPKSSKKPRAKK